VVEGQVSRIGPVEKALQRITGITPTDRQPHRAAGPASKAGLEGTEPHAIIQEMKRT
jgi:hypothetical protein